MVHLTEGGIDVEFEDGYRTGFYPKAMSDTMVEGTLGRNNVGRRRVQLV
jgi:hypothetical protein